jgi:hypothetical protein
MAQIVFNHIEGKPPFFDGISSFNYWKRKMKMYLGSINDRVWDVTEHDFVILDPTNLTDNERANKQCNTMALNTIYNGIDSKVFEQVKDLERASEVWTRLEETYEGTSMVKSAKLYMLKDKLSNFNMKDDESISKMFYRLQVIVNDLKSLGEKVKDEDFSHKFLMCLSKKFKTLRTIIFRGGLTNVSPNEVLGDVMIDAQYNDIKNEDEEKKEKKDKKEKSMAFKASSSSYKGKSKKEASSEDDDDIDDEAMALLVRKMGKFMKKRGYGARKRRDHMRDNVRLCFECKSPDHVVADCPYKRDNDENEKKKKKDKKDKSEKKEKKMTFRKKGSGYVVTWDSDGSNDNDDDDSSDDDKRSIKKALASIAIHNKPSLFDTPSTCLMAKPTKVKYDASDDESCANDDCRSDDEDDYSKEELIDICEQLSTGYEKKRKECKDLLKKLKALEKSFGELQASHECLKKNHEELELAHTKLEKAHSSLLEHAKEKEAKEEQVIITCDVGLTCDIIDESFYRPIVVALTNPSCSTFTSISSTSDGFTCDASLMVENEILKKEVNELTHALDKAYGGEDRLLIYLGSQRASLYKKGLGYTPKKSKAAFAPHKTSFMKNNDRFCTSCKQVGHKKQECKTKKSNAKVSSIKIDSFYVLTKGTNGVKAKFIGAPWMSSKKKAIWVPKSLVTNLQGPKQVWVSKKN